MNVIAMLHFMAQLIIAGAILRWIELRFADDKNLGWLSQALGVIY